ncbi:MAG: hypothetical protein P8X74_19230 [Reinekea sp.]
MIFSLWNGVKGKEGHIADPRLDQIYKSIADACQSDNCVILTLMDGEFGEDTLSVSAQSGNIHVTSFRNLPNDNDEVISLNNPNWEAESMRGLFYQEYPKLGKVPMVEIGGNYWDARSVTTDIEVVKTIFKEFFETGKISHLWMRQ